MKCPKCRKWMPIEAMSHECGWKTSARGGDVRVDRDGVVTTKKMPRSEVEVYLAKMRAIVSRRRARDMPKAEIEQPVIEGHDGMCVCEECCAGREAMRAKRARLEELKRQFPVE
jgi:hypothetical protein